MRGSGRIRVVAGTAGGLFLKTPPHFTSRPTQDRVKQAIFSSLGARVPGARVLDLYAGTGSFGIEALSRGAAEAVFVDSSKDCIACIRDNLLHCSLEGSVVQSDVSRYLQGNIGSTEYDLILADPVYRKEEFNLDDDPAVSLLPELLASDGMVVWEHARLSSFHHPARMKIVKASHYGKTSVTFLQRTE